MFFTLSKVVWWIAAPGNLLLLLICAGTVLLFTRWRRSGRLLVAAAALFGLAVAVLPLHTMIVAPLEDRFPASPPLPEHVDGIISLGGAMNMVVTQARGQNTVDDPVERLTMFVTLAKRYPDARLLFTGGTSKLDQGLREADFVGPFLAEIGLDPDRVVLYDNQARNTFENAVLARQMLEPKSGQNWILITSAAHMPRAIGCFRANGWTVIPYPVDFRTLGADQGGGSLAFAFARRLAAFEAGAHEWVGLLFYWLTNRVGTLFPGPEPVGS